MIASVESSAVIGALILSAVILVVLCFVLGFILGRRKARSTSEFRAFFRALPDLYFRLNASGVIMDYGAGRESDLYVAPSEFLGRTFIDVLPGRVSRILAKADARARETKGITIVEYPLTIAGERKYFEARLMSFPGDQMFCVVRDISIRRKAEKSLRASLVRQRVLMKEIQHRVKNNLQLIASLLDLQSGAVKDPHVFRLLQESQNRVRAIALVHAQLYETAHMKHGARIDFAAYVESLAFNLFRSYGATLDRVALDIQVAVPPFGLETAMNCGLILCELLSNTLKHAFPDGRIGAVKITVSEGADGTVRLSVVDNGVGFGSNPPSRSIGLQLIDTLSARLGGKLEFRSSNGVEAAMSFPLRAS
ncbi:MAG: PAS domain-containing protein [Spirochaetia bacterium]|nr:PAS domain-containing protein [Spirochaetia bacterium]